MSRKILTSESRFIRLAAASFTELLIIPAVTGGRPKYRYVSPTSTTADVTNGT